MLTRGGEDSEAGVVIPPGLSVRLLCTSQLLLRGSQLGEDETIVVEELASD